MRKRVLFYVAVLVQLGLLLGMIGRESHTTAYGQRIMLKCLPVDPRDLFRGDYVALNYEISNPNLPSLKGPKDHYKGQTLYVTLKKSGEFWTATGVYAHLPELASDELLIQGRIGNGRIVYGIERFFVPEGKGRPVEIAGRGQRLSAEIALDRFGHAVVTQIFIDGHPAISAKRSD
jgi:uncharacterized membrane-anchored protein